jgi:hypothetical protein
MYVSAGGVGRLPRTSAPAITTAIASPATPSPIAQRARLAPPPVEPVGVTGVAVAVSAEAGVAPPAGAVSISPAVVGSCCGG